MRDARQPLPRVFRPVHDGVRHRGPDGIDQFRAQCAQPLGGGLLLTGRRRHRRGEPGDRRRVHGPGANLALLAAAVQDRHQLGLAADEQRARAHGPAELVAGQAQRVQPAVAEVDRDGAHGLHRVGVHRDAVVPGGRDHGPHRLERAYLVVRPHHAHQRDRLRVAGDRAGQRVDVHPPLGVDRQQFDLGALGLAEPLDRVQHGVVLDRGHEHPHPARICGPARPEQPLEGEVVRLGAARGEHDLTRPGSQGGGDALP